GRRRAHWRGAEAAAAGRLADAGLGQRLHGDLRADAGGVTHGDTEEGMRRSARGHRQASHRRTRVSGSPKPPALVMTARPAQGPSRSLPRASPGSASPSRRSPVAPSARHTAAADSPPVRRTLPGRGASPTRARARAPRRRAVSARRSGSSTTPARRGEGTQGLPSPRAGGGATGGGAPGGARPARTGGGPGGGGAPRGRSGLPRPPASRRASAPARPA